MGNCWKQKAKDYLWSVVGDPCGGKGDYSDIVQQMDDIHFYNYPKNGEADSCCILCDNAVLHSCTEPSYDEDPEGAKWTALAAMYEPQSAGANDCAGCAQKIRQFKKNDAWFTDTSDFCELDEIFFGNSKYVSDINPLGAYHTGMIVSWGYIEELGTDGFTYIDGNTTYEGESGRVGYHYVAYGDPKIIGAGRPNWDGWEPDESVEAPKEDEKPKEDAKPEPDPVDDLPQSVSIDMDIIEIGDKGNQVETLQILLNAFGYSDQDGNKLVVDSIFGSRTDYAVKVFQEKHDIEPDGIVGFQTWSALLK